MRSILASVQWLSHGQKDTEKLVAIMCDYLNYFLCCFLFHNIFMLTFLEQFQIRD
jgi:hypothetical protein